MNKPIPAFFAFIFLLLLSFQVQSQQLQTLTGTVTNLQAKPINQAKIFILNTGLTAVTDQKGEFQIAAPTTSGNYQVQISAPGYSSTIKTIDINSAKNNLNFTLAEESRQLSEVVVAAQKRDEDPQKTAVSITTLSARAIEAYRLQNASQLTGIVPNLYSANPGDQRNVTSVRGISTTSYDPAVGTYIDGVAQFGLDTYISQLLDVERIEVLRGPQGTLYGRNAMAGIINIITKEPTNETTGSAGIELGNYGKQRYTLALRTPIVKDKLYFGVAGLYNHLDGFYTNLFNNTKFDRQHTFMGNYFLKYLAGQNWMITLNAKNTENRNNGAFPLAISPDEALNNPYQISQNSVGRMVDNLFNSSLSVQYSGPGFNFTSQSAYQSNHRYYQQPVDGDFSAADAVSIINNYGNHFNKVQVLTQEFRFSSPAKTNSAFKWATGIYSFYQDNPVKQGTHFGNDAALVGSPITDFTSINTNLGKNFGVAVYGQGTYALTQKLDLTLGLRYDYEHEKEQIKGEFQMDGQEAIVTQPDTASATAYHAFSPKAGLAFRVTENQLLYGTYSRGFRTGGISQLSSDPSQPPLYAYQPEYSNNFEIGSKNTFFNNRLRLNFTAFYTTVNHAQVPTLVLPDAITITRNVGKLHSKGLELELAATPFAGLEINSNIGLTDAKYTDLVLANNGKPFSGANNRPVFSPNATSMTALQYGRAISNDKKIKFFVRGEWLYVGDQFFDLANTIVQKPYHLFNSSFGIGIKNFNISFWERNLSGKKYVAYAYDFGATHLGDPRTFGISLSQRF